ncbi:MAG: response regulator [Treponema sp.]|nr:response regulator [Treponema sp.]
MCGVKANGKPYRVLIVDDSAFIAKQLSQILISDGFEIARIAPNGAVGLEVYKEEFQNIDLVTMDITMPKMDGISALEKVMAINKNAVVMMVSALGKEDMVKRSISIGAKGFIVKPLDRDKVLIRIASILED